MKKFRYEYKFKNLRKRSCFQTFSNDAPHLLETSKSHVFLTLCMCVCVCVRARKEHLYKFSIFKILICIFKSI